MHNIDVRNISLGHIQYFLKVAEYNSFTKAADHLHLTQSTISKNIAGMETMLGIQLFIREKQNIRLTPAGRCLYERWSGIADLIEATVEEAHVIQMGFFKSLAIGGLDSHRPDAFLLPDVEAFQRKHPSIRLRIDNSHALDIRNRLVDGKLDVIFTVLYDAICLDESRFNRELLGECPLEVCMLKTNPLAKKNRLAISDLKEYHFIAISPLQTPSYIEMLRSLCAPYGFAPDFACYTSNANALPLNLISGSDIFICDKFYRDYENKHLRFLPLEDTKSGFVMCWRKGAAKKEIDLFVEETIHFLKPDHSITE
ncbi:MAG: LysR family transcriptional regulator [Clostridiales Family XIII bacterium]|jgi:DNA-binding transcriptional LysR family regulator|nr:LysR family transcriptional regulator [Clostridiales Family XIII bacterium]